jgi:hypothetical protein
MYPAQTNRDHALFGTIPRYMRPAIGWSCLALSALVPQHICAGSIVQVKPKISMLVQLFNQN